MYLKSPITPIFINLGYFSLYFILLFLGFFLNILLFSVGSFFPNLFTYQPPPVACNNDLHFYFGLVCLGSSIIILKHSRKFCSKTFRQHLIKYTVAPIKTNTYVVEFDGSGKIPPLLSSSQDCGCYFSFASIEHMILYM